MHAYASLLGFTLAIGTLSASAGEMPLVPKTCKYDFGDARSPAAEGYERVAIEDTFSTARGSGLRYSDGGHERGWRKRNVQADQRLDTYVFDGGGLTFWQDLPNGQYRVSLASGCAMYDGRASVKLNGKEIVPLTQTRANEFVVFDSVRVDVADGRLTVDVGGLGRLNYLEITSAKAGADGSPESPPTSGRSYVRSDRTGAIDPELREKQFVVGRDADGPIVRINLDRIEDWTAVPGVKAHWKVNGPEGQAAAFHAIRSEIKDIDGDGRWDLLRLVNNHPYGMLARFDDTGRMLWKSDKLPPATGDESGLPVDDLDGDGRYECVLSQRGVVYCIDAHEGKVKWKAPTASTNDEKDASLAIGRFADTESYGVVVRAGMTVHCFDARGKTLWTYGLDPDRYQWYGHEVHPHDVDGDGYDEVFIGLNQATLAIAHDGKLLWEDRTQKNHSDFFQFGDIDGDGRTEVAYDHDGCGGKGPILIVDGVTGARKSTIDYRKIGLAHAQCLAVADFRPDLPGLEIACTDKSRMLAVWSAGADLLWKKDTPASLVARADWNGDGTLEIVVDTVGINQDPSLSVWDGHGNRLYAVSWLPLLARSFTAIASREEGQHVQTDLDGNGKADVPVAFGPWDYGAPQNIVVLESPEPVVELAPSAHE